MSGNAQTLQQNYIVQVGKYKIGQYIEYKGGTFKIESFPNGHSILASNTSSTSDLPDELRILIMEL